MPAIFFGHGNPMNAIRENAWTKGWSAIGAALPRPKAIVCVSAHWYPPASCGVMSMDYVLSIEDERTVLAAETSGVPPVVLAGIGVRTMTRDYLKHDPPSPLELEHAIAAIEDEIARAPALPPPGSRLRTSNALIRQIALAAGAETPFAVTAVEQAFQRLAEQASRGLRSGDGLAAGGEPAAALVILRELMHHMGFASLVVQTTR